MKPDDLKVKFRTKAGDFITARLEIGRNRYFAVLYEYGPKGTDEIIKEERIQLEARFMQKIDPALGADYLYKKDVDFPDPRKN